MSLPEYVFKLTLHGLQGVGQQKKKGRGCLKGIAAATKRVRTASQKLKITFSARGGPVDENYRTFVDEVVMFTKKRAPLIGVKMWKDVHENVKNTIVADVLVSNILF